MEFQPSRFLLLVVIAATVSGAVSIIVFYVSPRVVQPLVDMTSALVRLAAGDKTIELPAQDRKDEVGDMAMAFKVFKDTAQARTNLSRYFSPKLVEELYLTFFSRYPSDKEKQAALEYLKESKPNRRQGAEDLAWSMLNSLEFLFNH